jgi:cytochrome c-type biogenesis protein CcmF
MIILLVVLEFEMAYETGFLVIAALLSFFDLTLLSISKPSRKLKISYGFYGVILAFALIAISYVLFLQAFIGNNFSFIEVHSYSSSGLPLMSKVYASWGGARGSMLFLTLLLGIFYLAIRFLTWKKPDRFNITASQVFSIIVIVFLAICLVKNPFEQFTVAPVEGKGLNPQLQSVWMAIHPPIVFAAYAFVLLAYTLTLASMKTGRELSSIKLFKASTYMAWLLLTIGIALGGVWAYEVLGWGGYWAWDPVETASLLPWLFLTAYFLFNSLFQNKRSFTRELMIMITFASLVFLSALTRGGFTQSVHSYSISPVAPIMIVFSVVMISYFLYLKRVGRQPLFKLEVERTSMSRSSFIGFWALIFIAIICFAGLAFPNFSYNMWTFPFVMAFIAALIGCSFSEKTRFVRLLLIVIGTLAVSLFMVLIQVPAIHVLSVLSLPLLSVAILAAFHKLIRVSRKKAIKLFGQSLVHLGIIALLIGVFVSAGAKSTRTIAAVEPGISYPLSSGVAIETGVFTVSTSQSNVYNEELGAVVPECSSISGDITIQYMGKTYHNSLSASFYPNYGLVIRPLIITTETGDIYLHLDYTDELYDSLTQTLTGNTVTPESVAVTVQISPLIYLVWAGVALMVVSISLQAVIDLAQKSKKGQIKHKELTPNDVQQVVQEAQA